MIASQNRWGMKSHAAFNIFAKSGVLEIELLDSIIKNAPQNNGFSFNEIF